MNHDSLRFFALYTVYFLIFFIPFLVFVYTDHFRRQPSPRQYVSLFLAASLVGILLFLPAVSVVAGTALVAVFLAWTSAQFALRGVTYSRTLSPPRLFPGDQATLQIELRNQKLLPLAWVSLTDPISYGAVRSSTQLDTMLEVSAGVTMLDDQQHALIIRTAIAPYQSIIRTYDVTAHQRGVYVFGPGRIETGDPFGIFERGEQMGTRQEVLVYPRVYQPGELGLPFREAMGNLVTRKALYQDPTLLAGSREYQPGDPLKNIHWKATARTGALQVRLHDPSTTAQVMVVLNINTFQKVWQGIDIERMELAIEAGASVALWALDHDFAVGLRSNGIVAGADNTPRISPGAHPRQGAALLEYLARISFSGRFFAEDILLDEASRLPAGGTIMFITSVLSPEIVNVLTSSRLTGRVSVIYCGRVAAMVLPNVPMYFVRPPAETARAAS